MVYGLRQAFAMLAGVAVFFVLWSIAMPDYAFAYGIDDMVGNKWRVGTFMFLIFGMVLYSAFVVIYMRRGRGDLKKGESILLWCILGGVMLGFVVSFVQFVEGFLL